MTSASSAQRRRAIPCDSLELQVCVGVLREQHANLDRIYEALLGAYRSGDWAFVQDQWRVFESALRQHIDVEEKHVFPTFELANPAEADTLHAEHRALEKLLETLGVNIELHSVTAYDAETLIRRLREHAKREESVLYPWLDSPAFA